MRLTPVEVGGLNGSLQRSTVSLGVVADTRGSLRRYGAGCVLFLVTTSMLVVGCSQSGRSPAGGPGAGSAGAPGADAQLVRAYVAAVDDGDVRGAMALRCTAARIAPGDELEFATDARQLHHDLGAIGVSSVTAADPVGLTPIQAGAHPKELLVRLSYGGQTASGSLRFVAVDEGHERRLCGVQTDPPVAPRDLPVPADLGSTRASPHQMLPTSGPAGWSQLRDAKHDPEQGEMAAASRVWRPTSFGGARVTAIQFTTSDKAAEATSDWVSHLAGDAVETFAVPDVPGAIGIRFLGRAWTWVQAPSVAPLQDRVVLRGGDRVALADVTITVAHDDHHLVLALAEQVATRAHFH